MKVVTMCCTTCPSSCALTVTIDDDQVVKVTGNTCPRGIVFAENEWVNPVRILTSTVLGGIGDEEILIPVRTSEPIPKSKIEAAMEEIRNVRFSEPVKIGEVIVSNIAGTDTDLIACKTIK